MKVLPVIALFSLLLAVSGCITGQVTDEDVIITEEDREPKAATESGESKENVYIPEAPAGSQEASPEADEFADKPVEAGLGPPEQDKIEELPEIPEEEVPEPDPCEGVECPASELECPDDFVSSCQNSCSQGVCSSCTPDCSGHDAPALDHVVFSEVFYNTPGKDSDEEWIEIHNPTEDPASLTGWSISDNSGTWHFPDIMMQPGSYLVIARDSPGFSSLFSCPPDIDTFTRRLNNNGDQLSLKDSEGKEIDFVAWDSGASDEYLEWDIEAEEGTSIQRIPAQDTGQPSDWLSEQEPEPANC